MKKAKWPGEWKVVCDVCGFQYPSSELLKRWDGQMVCPKDYETRHPSDFFRLRGETAVPDYVRPEPDDDFVVICSVEGSHAYADMAEADCSQADKQTISYSTLLDLLTNGHE